MPQKTYKLSDLEAYVDDTPESPNAIEGFIRNSPIGAVQGAAEFIRHPIDTTKAVVEQNAGLLDKAKESYKNGDYTGALFHTLNYFLPGGTALDDAGEDFQNGNVQSGVGKTLGIASNLVAGAKAPQILGAVGSAADAVDTVKRMASNPDVIRKGVKVIPKGPALLDFVDTVKKAANDKPVTSASVAEDPDLSVKNGIAQGFKYKDYNSAPASAQVIIDNLAENMKTEAQSKVTPIRPPIATQVIAEEPVVTQPEPVPSKQPYKPKETMVPGRPVRPPLKSSEAVPPAASEVSPPSAGDAVPGGDHTVKTELEDLLERSLQNPRMAAAAKQELNQHLQQEALKKTADIVDKAQTVKALKLGKFLVDYGITPEHIGSMSTEEWHQVGDLAGITKPSATTIQKTIDLMRMGQE